MKKIVLLLSIIAMGVVVGYYLVQPKPLTDEQIADQTKTMTRDELIAYCTENKIDYTFKEEESDEITAGKVVNQQFEDGKLTVTLSSGYKMLHIANSLGADRNAMDIVVADFDANYAVFDYEYEFEEGCENDGTCIVIAQSFEGELTEPTTVVYKFGHPAPTFGYIDPYAYLGSSVENFIASLNELGYYNLKDDGTMYSNYPKGTICSYLPDGNREFEDVIKYKISLGVKPKPAPSNTAGSNSGSSSGSNTGSSTGSTDAGIVPDTPSKSIEAEFYIPTKEEFDKLYPDVPELTEEEFNRGVNVGF